MSMAMFKVKRKKRIYLVLSGCLLIVFLHYITFLVLVFSLINNNNGRYLRFRSKAQPGNFSDKVCLEIYLRTGILQSLNISND